MRFCVCTGGTGPTTFRVLDSKGDAIGEVLPLSAWYTVGLLLNKYDADFITTQVMLSFETAPVREGADSSDFRVHVYKIDGFPHSVRGGWGGQV